MTTGIAAQAKQAGLTFNFAEIKSTNTFDAHRITKYAKEHGKANLISEKLLYAHFTEAKDVGDIEVLADIAATSGLDREESLAVLQEETNYANDVRADIAGTKPYQI